jgi:hypothetical protein
MTIWILNYAVARIYQLNDKTSEHTTDTNKPTVLFRCSSITVYGSENYVVTFREG